MSLKLSLGIDFFLGTPELNFLILVTIDIWGQIILCGGTVL